MRLLRWVAVLLICLFFFGVAVRLVTDNALPVHLVLGPVTTPDLPLGFHLVVAFISGALVNQLYAGFQSFFLYRRLRWSSREQYTDRQDVDDRLPVEGRD